MDGHSMGRAMDESIKALVLIVLIVFVAMGALGFWAGYKIGEGHGKAAVRHEAFQRAMACEAAESMRIDDLARSFGSEVNCGPLIELAHVEP